MVKQKKEKLKIKEFLEENPHIKEELNKLSLEYIGKIQKFVASNTDVCANVRVSFEFFRE
jgi:hypothetical protein